MSAKAANIPHRAGRGSLTGRWSPRADRRPNLTGAIITEVDLPAGSRLWLAGWTRSTAGCEEFVSLVADVAVGGPRKGKARAPRRDSAGEPEGKFRDKSITG